MLTLEQSAKMIQRGEGTHLTVIGVPITIKLTGEETGGAYMLFETTTAPGGGVPTHTHSREDETFYIVEGEVEVCVGDETIAARAGDTAFLPRDIPHSWRVTGDRPARLVIMASPAGFEDFFVEMSRLGADAQPEDMLDISARHGIEFLPPSH